MQSMVTANICILYCVISVESEVQTLVDSFIEANNTVLRGRRIRMCCLRLTHA